jgi:exodeoxyribonuclease VII small subunit
MQNLQRKIARMQKNTEAPQSYESAWEELQQIVVELQAESVSVDKLAEKIERAAALAAYCRERLRSTEAALEKLAKFNT